MILFVCVQLVSVTFWELVEMLDTVIVLLVNVCVCLTYSEQSATNVNVTIGNLRVVLGVSPVAAILMDLCHHNVTRYLSDSTTLIRACAYIRRRHCGYLATLL